MTQVTLCPFWIPLLLPICFKFRMYIPQTDTMNTLSLKRNATFLHGFLLGRRVRVMWPGVMRNLHMATPYSLVYTLLQKKGNLKKVAFFLERVYECMTILITHFHNFSMWPFFRLVLLCVLFCILFFAFIILDAKLFQSFAFDMRHFKDSNSFFFLFFFEYFHTLRAVAPNMPDSKSFRRWESHVTFHVNLAWYTILNFDLDPKFTMSFLH